MESISWDDAIKFIKKLNAMEGSEKYRLPTEAEWEYAARGGKEKKSRYGPVKEIAWTRSNSGKKTHPVGEKAPNGYGLYDTLGNVAEWVQDWFGKYSKEAQTDPVGPEEGEFRVRRGSCQIGEYKLGLNQGCRVEHRGLATRKFSSGPTPIAGPVSISIGFDRSKKPPDSDRGVGFRLLRTAP